VDKALAGSGIFAKMYHSLIQKIFVFLTSTKRCNRYWARVSESVSRKTIFFLIFYPPKNGTFLKIFENFLSSVVVSYYDASVWVLRRKRLAVLLRMDTKIAPPTFIKGAAINYQIRDYFTSTGAASFAFNRAQLGL
jgi:hypothetical protein